MGAFGGARPQLVVWNVLTRGTWWTLPLAVSCLTADPAGEHFAVTVSNLAAAAGGDPQQAAALDPGAEAVLAFQPESPRPRYSWASRQPLAAVLFAPRNTAVHVAAQKLAPQVRARGGLRRVCVSMRLFPKRSLRAVFVVSLAVRSRYGAPAGDVAVDGGH